MCCGRLSDADRMFKEESAAMLTPSAMPSAESTMTPSASPETAEGLKGILEAIRQSDEIQLPMSVDVDDTVLADMSMVCQ